MIRGGRCAERNHRVPEVVEVTMARERITSRADARETRDNYRDEAVMYLAPRTKAGPRETFGVAGTGMDGIEVDLDALHNAEQELRELQKKLQDHLEQATELGDQLHDGKTLVARHMRQAFLDRVDAEGGVQAALEDYIDEVDEVRMRIRETLATYQELDSDAAARILAQGVD
jgi:hypothetical protein